MEGSFEMNTVSGVSSPPRFALTLPKQAIREYRMPTPEIFPNTKNNFGNIKYDTYAKCNGRKNEALGRDCYFCCPLYVERTVF